MDIPQSHLFRGSGGLCNQNLCPRVLGPNKVRTVDEIVIEYIFQNLNVIRTRLLTKFL